MSNTEAQTRILSGIVVSDAMDKTIVVEVTTQKSHPMYKKRYNVSKRYKAHDEQNTYKVGDAVEIKESRPRSKTKRWVVISKQ